MSSRQKNNLELLKALGDAGVSIQDKHLLSQQELHFLEELPLLLEMMATDMSLDEKLRQAISSVIDNSEQKLTSSC
jgi:hypothetical protein